MISSILWSTFLIGFYFQTLGGHTGQPKESLIQIVLCTTASWFLDTPPFFLRSFAHGWSLGTSCGTYQFQDGLNSLTQMAYGSLPPELGRPRKVSVAKQSWSSSVVKQNLNPTWTKDDVRDFVAPWPPWESWGQRFHRWKGTWFCVEWFIPSDIIWWYVTNT